MKPLAIDLFCGLGGWTDGLLSEGYDVVGYDIEAHEYDGERYPAELVIADCLTLDGAQFAEADLIVASPPCTEYSYMAMPWTRAKQIGRALRCKDEFPDGYCGSRTVEELNALFNASFRIQREASQTAGRNIPLIVENVRGAIPWVGRSRWNYGSFHLWGDVPALMPSAANAQKFNPDGTAHPSGSWFAIADSKNRGVRNEGLKNGNGGSWFGINPNGTPGALNNARDGLKQPGISGPRDNGKGDRWFQDGAAKSGSKSTARKAASARIAKIPLPLSRWIAAQYLPEKDAA